MVGAAILLASAPARAADPVIDMHVHARFTERAKPIPGCPGDQPIEISAVDPAAKSASPDPTCPRPILSPTRRADFERRTIAELRRAGVTRAVLIGPPTTISRWQSLAPGLFIPADSPENYTQQAVDSLRALNVAGKVAVFAELGVQYEGVAADDPQLEPFWALAEQRDVPVGIHLGEGAPGIALVANYRYRVALTSPFQLEAVLKRHPRLRIWVMHAASPLTDEMIAMLYAYPTLYVDVAANDWSMPRAQFYNQLKRLVEAGYGKRILFGSDQTIWPEAIGLAVRSIRNAPFLTRAQKRDILYNNAARFLRLTKEQIAADHR